MYNGASTPLEQIVGEKAKQLQEKQEAVAAAGARLS